MDLADGDGGLAEFQSPTLASAGKLWRRSELNGANVILPVYRK